MKTVTQCRACEGTDLTSVLGLGNQPLANRFLTDEETDQPEQKYPLHLVRCLTCGLAQLSVVVNPEILYGANYPYRSGYSKGWWDHCSALAEEIGSEKSVLDIGCLDAVLLECCAANNCTVRGCDPSGTRPWIVPELFTQNTRIGKFDVIVAQNVFGHVDDAKGFLQGVAGNLAPDGVAIIEVPWVVDMVTNGAWDTIYHEHLSYWGFGSLHKLQQLVGLYLHGARHFPSLHGGTMRFYLGHDPHVRVTMDLAELVVRDANLSGSDWDRFIELAYGDIRRWETFFATNRQRAIAAYGASAKLNTFLNALPTRPHIMGVFDDNPAKWNLYTPGCHYPVLVPTKMTLRETEILLVGASNWKAEIEAKARSMGFAGEVVSLW